MTVASQLKQTLASLKNAEATLHTYALHHPDKSTKAEFEKCQQDIQEIITQLETRVQQIEFEEPQFKGF